MSAGVLQAQFIFSTPEIVTYSYYHSATLPLEKMNTHLDLSMGTLTSETQNLMLTSSLRNYSCKFSRSSPKNAVKNRLHPLLTF